MAQKVSPTSNRTYILYGPDSIWFTTKKDTPLYLKEDHQIRTFIQKNVPSEIISKIIIERTLKAISITIHTSKAGIVIGPGGERIQNLIQKLKKTFNKSLQVNVQEVKRPELDAHIVAKNIAKQILGRVRYKQAVKQAINDAMRIGAQGIKITVAGRPNGSAIAQRESYHQGRVPLHTIRADIDYAKATANTIYGSVGIKVWIFLKEVYGKRDFTLQIAPSKGTRKNTPPPRSFARNKA